MYIHIEDSRPVKIGDVVRRSTPNAKGARPTGRVVWMSAGGYLKIRFGDNVVDTYCGTYGMKWCEPAPGRTCDGDSGDATA